MQAPTSLTRLLGAIRHSFSDAVKVSFGLFRVMVPIIIAVKILNELDLIKYLALPLKPLMALTGLPADLGLAWASGMAVNIYSGLLVFASLLPHMDPLTGAQATIFATMMLFAHSLPVEGRIAKQCGVAMLPQLALRIGVALVSGVLLNALYAWGGWLQTPAPMLWQPAPPAPDLAMWALGEARNLFSLFWVIYALMLFKRAMDHFDVTRLLNAALRPLLRLLGIGPSAATVAVVGASMGLIYGSGLIIQETQKGTISRRDVLCVISLMGLAHALIEDTLLMVLIGGDLSGTLVARVVLALVVTGILARCVGNGDAARPAPAGA